jgi:hypothetical protein
VPFRRKCSAPKSWLAPAALSGCSLHPGPDGPDDLRIFGKSNCARLIPFLSAVRAPEMAVGGLGTSTLTGMDPGVLKLADPPLARANGLRHRSLGGKRGPGDSPLSRPQPPQAVAEGQSLQGTTITRPRSVTEGDVRVRLAPGCGGADPPERERLVGHKNEHTPGQMT